MLVLLIFGLPFAASIVGYRACLKSDDQEGGFLKVLAYGLGGSLVLPVVGIFTGDLVRDTGPLTAIIIVGIGLLESVAVALLYVNRPRNES